MELRIGGSNHEIVMSSHSVGHFYGLSSGGRCRPQPNINQIQAKPVYYYHGCYYPYHYHGHYYHPRVLRYGRWHYYWKDCLTAKHD